MVIYTQFVPPATSSRRELIFFLSYQNNQEPPSQNQCVFIRGFRAKRTFFRTIRMRAAAEPLPDDPDNRQEDEIQVTRIPDSSNVSIYII